MRSWRKIVGEKPKVPYDSGKEPVTGTNPAPPQPSTSDPTSPETLSPDAVEKLLHKIMKEGGNASIAYLLAQAVSSCCGTKRSNAIWVQTTHKRIVDLSDSDKA